MSGYNMKKPISKKAKLLHYLQTHKAGISGQDAWLKFGLYRLSGEIHQLRKEGYNIRTRMVQPKDPNESEFAVYYLEVSE